MVVLGRPKYLLVHSPSAPAAIGTQHNVLTCFHVGPPVTNVALHIPISEIEISYAHNRKKLSLIAADQPVQGVIFGTVAAEALVRVRTSGSSGAIT